MIVALGFVLLPLSGVVADSDLPTAVLDPVERYDLAIYSSGWLTSDRDSNGTVDYAIQLDDLGYRVLEAMDFNYDGVMDDFYFYSNDVLQRQEVDSNFDQSVDIWIFMWRGVYIRRWERDSDHDGLVDVVQDYDAPR